jgi:hypothetical protein
VPAPHGSPALGQNPGATGQTGFRSSSSAAATSFGQHLSERGYLCVYLRTVIEVILVHAPGAKEELHAVAADSVVAGIHDHVSARPDRAPRIFTRDDSQGGLDQVPLVALGTMV